MGTFIAAYAIVWLSLALYVVRLRARQSQLEAVARMLESQLRDFNEGAETAMERIRGL